MNQTNPVDALMFAEFLQKNPDFFDQHPEIFARMQVPHPHGDRAVSLSERQILTLRERQKKLEQQIMEMIRNARENEAINDLFLQWSRGLLIERDLMRLPDAMAQSLSQIFNVPDVAVRVWHPLNQTPPDGTLWAQSVSDDVKRFSTSLMAPYCGENTGVGAAAWLEADARSVAFIPLRIGYSPDAFGLLVLGSPDPDRFTENMGTSFLARIGEFASAAVSRVLA